MPHAVTIPNTGFQALILCGPGIGLNTFTSVPQDFPKALVTLANRPIIWYVLDWCYRMGVTDITIITPPTSKGPISSALAQNPHLTSLPSPRPDILAPAELEFNTPTAELLRLPEVQDVIKSDFVLLPCDLVCDVAGDTFIETYLTSVAALGGTGTDTNGTSSNPIQAFNLGAAGSGRRGGLSVWYNTANREESVKKEECDFMGTVNLKSQHSIVQHPQTNSSSVRLRQLVWTIPMSELLEQAEEDKAWKVRQSLLQKHGSVKCMTQYRDSHIYFLPYWVKEFARINEDFESFSEDLIGTWAKADWRKASYRARFGADKIFEKVTKRDETADDRNQVSRPVEEEIDLLSLSSTQVTQHGPNTTPLSRSKIAQLASRVQAKPEDSMISAGSKDNDEDDADDAVPILPPVLSYILPSDPKAPLVRRVDTTPLLLSVSLALAKLPSVEEDPKSSKPFSHSSKIHSTVTVPPKCTISRNDTLIDANVTLSPQCVIRGSCIGASVQIGQGARITNCVIMEGATIGEKVFLTGAVVGKKAIIGKGVTLKEGSEVQDGMVIPDGTEGAKGEKFLVGGFEDDEEGEFGYGEGEDDDEDADED